MQSRSRKPGCESGIRRKTTLRSAGGFAPGSSMAAPGWIELFVTRLGASQSASHQHSTQPAQITLEQRRGDALHAAPRAQLAVAAAAGATHAVAFARAARRAQRGEEC